MLASACEMSRFGLYKDIVNWDIFCRWGDRPISCFSTARAGCGRFCAQRQKVHNLVNFKGEHVEFSSSRKSNNARDFLCFLCAIPMVQKLKTQIIFLGTHSSGIFFFLIWNFDRLFGQK